MRQPAQGGIDGKPRYPRALQSSIPGAYSPSPRDRVNAGRDRRRTNSGAVRATIALVLVLLVAMLAYLLSLSSKPSVTELKPSPGSTTEPGMVLVEAHVAAAKPIARVTLTIDGVVQTPAVVTQGSRAWVVRVQNVFSQGTHQASIDVRDTSGKVRHESWSFLAAGPRVAPNIVFSNPPANATLPQGVVRLSAAIGSDTEIKSATLTVAGEQIPVVTTFTGSASQPAQGKTASAPQMTMTAERAFTVGNYIAHVSATDSQGDTAVTDWPFAVTADPAQATARYFASTRIYVVDQFKAFWEAHNGSELFGDPISDQFIDEHGTSVQYFQRARFELAANNNVLLGLIGGEALGSTQPRIPMPENFTGLYFSATGHTLAGKFKDFWTQNGGLEIFGYPISEVVDQNGTKVQYFERARFELAQGPNNTTTVELTPLGQQLWSALNAAPAS
jgi:hypothetical protein